MTSQPNNHHNLAERIAAVQRELDACNDEATRLQRRMNMAEHIDDRGAHQRGKGQGGDVQASAQRGELQQVEERAMALRKQLSELQEQAGAQSAAQAATGGAEPPEHDPLSGQPELAIGVMAWVAQAGGPATRLRTAPDPENAGIIAHLEPGAQMTVLDGPADVEGENWWRIRTTDGQEGWLPTTGLRAIQP